MILFSVQACQCETGRDGANSFYKAIEGRGGAGGDWAQKGGLLFQTPEFGGRMLEFFRKQPAEIFGIVEPDGVGNLGNGHRSGRQQLAGPAKAQGPVVARDRHTRECDHLPVEGRAAHAHFVINGFHRRRVVTPLAFQRRAQFL